MKSRLQEQALAAITEYRKAYEKWHTVEEEPMEIYNLIRSADGPGDPYLYESLCIDLLQALADPVVSKRVQEISCGHYDELPRMLTGLHHFFQQIQLPEFESKLDFLQVDQFQTSDKQLQSYIEEYQTKLRVLKAERPDQFSNI